MPALLRELHALIPSFSNQFMWADGNQQLSNLYSESPDPGGLATVYIQEFYNRRDEDVGHFSNVVRYQKGVMNRDQSLTVDKRRYYNGELYNGIFRPFGYDDFLRLIVREEQRPLGALCLFRDRGSVPFTPKEAQMLASLEPFVAHALTRQPDPGLPLMESGESGLIIANADGKPVYFSPQAQRLLFLATHPQVKQGKISDQPVSLPAPLVQICRNLASVFTDDESAPVPVHQHTNAWGGFVFRAYRLEAVETSPCLIGIAVSHQEPLPLKLMRQVEQLPLTRRQAQICILVASGLSYKAIAERLHISRHTVIAHTRWIRNNLNVANRNELLNRLLDS
jgi:DNA-binding CsgD family transcriptional regulator